MRSSGIAALAIVLAIVGCDSGGDADDTIGGTDVLVPSDEVADTSVEDTSTSVEVADTSTSIEDTSTSTSIEDTSIEDTSTSTSVEDTSTSTSIEDTSTSTSVEDSFVEDTSVEDTTTSVEDVVVVDLDPLVAFRLEDPRTLYFLNNPEQIVTSDLGDAGLGDKTLYRVTATGACRSFFEHLNRTGRTIGFGVQLYNPGPGARTITVRGVGWVASIQGGVPFAEALSGTGAAAATELASGASMWILRRDESIAINSFFSGVVDFDVAGGSVIVNHVAYDTFGSLDGSTSELGYVQRIEADGTHEARMYKGRASASEAHLEPLAWVVDDATPAGPLPVRVRRYDLDAPGFDLPIAATSWTTHIGPAQNVAAATSDMVAFDLPSWGVFDPLTRSDGEGKYPNLGNWGVVYRLAPTVTNDGTRARVVTLRITASPGAGAVLAKRAGAGAWTSHHVAAGATLTLATATVGAGQAATISADWVLGGPAGGGIKHELVID